MMPPFVAIRRGTRIFGVAGMLPLLALLGGCQADNIGFPAQPIACSVAAPMQLEGTPAAPAASMSAVDMRLSLQDLKTRVVPSLPAGSARDDLERNLVTLVHAVGSKGTAAQCLGVQGARDALAGIPVTQETAADRVTVELTLDLVATSLASSSP